jgi:hypothetical protein
MSHAPEPDPDPATGPFSKPPRPHQFVNKPPCMLDALLSSKAHTGTRFGMYASRRAPTDPTKVAKLLEACGYDVRRASDGGIELRGTSGRWKPAPVPVAIDPMLSLLRRVAVVDAPARPTDLNDLRFDIVFAAT